MSFHALINDVANIFTQTAAARTSVVGAGSSAGDGNHCNDRRSNRDAKRNCDTTC